jgi:hypothetical protein
MADSGENELMEDKRNNKKGYNWTRKGRKTILLKLLIKNKLHNQ